MTVNVCKCTRILSTESNHNQNSLSNRLWTIGKQLCNIAGEIQQKKNRYRLLMSQPLNGPYFHARQYYYLVWNSGYSGLKKPSNITFNRNTKPSELAILNSAAVTQKHLKVPIFIEICSSIPKLSLLLFHFLEFCSEFCHSNNSKTIDPIVAEISLVLSKKCHHIHIYTLVKTQLFFRGDYNIKYTTNSS